MLPVLVNFQDTTVLVIGFGPVGQHKARTLHQEGASIIVVDPNVNEEMIISNSNYIFKRRPYITCDLEGIDFIVICTQDKLLNNRIAEEAKSKHVLCTVASNGHSSRFTFMSVFNRGHLSIGISTQCLFPGLSKKVRHLLENSIPEDYGEYVEYMAAERKKLLLENPDEKAQLMNTLMMTTYDAYKRGRD